MESLGNARVILRIRGFASGPVMNTHIRVIPERGLLISTERHKSYFRFYNQLGQSTTQAQMAEEVGQGTRAKCAGRKPEHVDVRWVGASTCYCVLEGAVWG